MPISVKNLLWLCTSLWVSEWLNEWINKVFVEQPWLQRVCYTSSQWAISLENAYSVLVVKSKMLEGWDSSFLSFRAACLTLIFINSSYIQCSICAVIKGTLPWQSLMNRVRRKLTRSWVLCVATRWHFRHSTHPQTQTWQGLRLTQKGK